MCMIVVLQALAINEFTDNIYCDKSPGVNNTELIWFVRVSLCVNVYLCLCMGVVCALDKYIRFPFIIIIASKVTHVTLRLWVTHSKI